MQFVDVKLSHTFRQVTTSHITILSETKNSASRLETWPVH